VPGDPIAGDRVRGNGAGALELRILGPLEALVDGQAIALGGAKPRTLLAILALEVGRVVSIDRIVEELWPGEAPDTAAHAVKVYVSQLRKAIPSAAIETIAPGYALHLAAERVDANRFGALSAEGRTLLHAHDPERAAAVLREALDLWRGEALADFAYEPFAQPEIARLADLRLATLEDRIDADLALGRGAELIGELEALIAASPFRERLRGQLMLALYRAGRQADALSAYRDARTSLVEELGIEPGVDLRALEGAILRQDESLRPSTGQPAPPRRTRRLVTVVSVDVEPAEEALDPEAEGAALERFGDVFAATVTRFGGSSARPPDGSLVATFGFPVAHEDDPIRAARAAIAAREASPLTCRVGLETGEVVAGGGEVGGRPFKIAARLCRAAAPGEIVVGETAAPLLGLATRLELRRDGSFSLAEMTASPTAFGRYLDGKLVGRRGDLAALRGALRRATEESHPRVVTVVGPAGIGKSRLAHELVSRAKGVTSLAATCPAYGDGLTYLPLRALVREAAGGESRAALLAALAGELDGETVAGRLADALGEADTSVPTGDVSWAFRRLCEALARKRPVMIVVDDLQWAAPAFLELLEHLVTHGQGPMLVVALAREDLDEGSPAFLAGLRNAERLDVGPLRPADVSALLEQLGGETLLEGQRQQISDAAEGNPLYVEQLLVLASEGGLGSDRPLPATIQALLAARLDRLGPGERAVLECAAVVGREFDEPALGSLLAAEAVPTMERHLQQLVARGFLRSADRGELGFRHGLVRETVYRAMPKAERSDLHERHADQLDRRTPTADELVGYHLEQAFLLRAELGPLDRHGRQLSVDAGRRLGEAGMRALKRVDYPAAVNLLRRATALLDDADEVGLELRCELGGALTGLGDDVASDAVLETTRSSAQSAGRRRLVLRAQLEQVWPGLLSGTLDAAAALTLANEAIPLFEAHGDDRGLARAWSQVAAVRGTFQGRRADADDAATRALEYVRRTGFSPEGCFAMLAASAYWGPTPVPAAIFRCEQLLASAAGAQSAPIYVLPQLAGLEAMRGRFDDAREHLARARDLAMELGRADDLAYDWVSNAARIELLADCPEAAEAILRPALELHLRRGTQAWVATHAAALAEALCGQGRLENALHMSEEAMAASLPDDIASETGWRLARAKALARVGDPTAATPLAVRAVEIVEATDMVSWRGEALVDLAEVYSWAERPADAAAAADRGFSLLEEKGNIAAVERARATLGVFDGA
jgi:DNA-binding SARP family transcriptional activator